jgi:predicted  nucleic acid-binding Zn-ribbon protein
MNKFLKLTYAIIIGTMFLSGGIIGCSPKLSEEESTKLQEAKEAAVSAEKKLSELRMERKSLETQNGGEDSDMGNVEEQTPEAQEQLPEEEQEEFEE